MASLLYWVVLLFAIVRYEVQVCISESRLWQGRVLFILNRLLALGGSEDVHFRIR